MTRIAKSCPVGDLPDELPIFPLSGVLLLPRGHLPLNIFEPRYLAMVDHALRTHRLIGMVQPKFAVEHNQPDKGEGNSALADLGCAGRITAFEEMEDGRYVITLTGVCRFSIAQELDKHNGFRRVKPEWQSSGCDYNPPECLDIERKKLKNLLARFFDQQGLTVDWTAIDLAADEKLITALAMICPFTPAEKQALLKAGNCHERAGLFMSLLEVAVVSGENDCTRTLQ